MDFLAIIFLNKVSLPQNWIGCQTCEEMITKASLWSTVFLIGVFAASFSGSGSSSSSNRRRQIINTKDHWLVTGRNKAQVDSWFKEYLANSSRPFSQLVRKIPIFNKRDEIIVGLCEHQVWNIVLHTRHVCYSNHPLLPQVPVNRGVWFIKMSAAHQIAISETSKTKKRQAPDPTNDWTSTLVRFLKDQLSDIGKLIQVLDLRRRL